MKDKIIDATFKFGSFLKESFAVFAIHFVNPAGLTLIDDLKCLEIKRQMLLPPNPGAGTAARCSGKRKAPGENYCLRDLESSGHSSGEFWDR